MCFSRLMWMRAIWLPDVIFIKQRLQRLENSILYIRRIPNVTYAEEQLKWSAWLRATAVSTPWAKRGTLDCRIFCVPCGHDPLSTGSPAATAILCNLCSGDEEKTGKAGTS